MRNAYGSLLPSVSVGSDLGYTGSGQSNFGGGFVRPTSAFVTSGYNLSLQWQLDGRALTAPAEQKALQQATDEDISGAGIDAPGGDRRPSTSPPCRRPRRSRWPGSRSRGTPTS